MTHLKQVPKLCKIMFALKEIYWLALIQSRSCSKFEFSKSLPQPFVKSGVHCFAIELERMQQTTKQDAANIILTSYLGFAFTRDVILQPKAALRNKAFTCMVNTIVGHRLRKLFDFEGKEGWGGGSKQNARKEEETTSSLQRSFPSKTFLNL